MIRPLLAIIVPTYNRARCLRMLLTALLVEVEGLGDRVLIVVGDNASSDDTPQVIDDFKSAFPAAVVIRHDRNLGADENFCLCIERANADYFWLIGDDDLPRAGAIRLIADLLERRSPDMVYVANKGLREIRDNEPQNPMRSIQAKAIGKLEFARRLNVWATFISGMIVRRAVFVDGATPAELRQHENTNLVQLAWVFGTLALGESMLYIEKPCILATVGNTGGYAVLEVFGANFPAITRRHFGNDSELTCAILQRFVIGYLPGLLWGVRVGNVGDFKPEIAADVLGAELSTSSAYRPLIWIATAPRPFARTLLVFCKLLAKALALRDRI